MKDHYNDDRASSDPYEDESSEEEGEIDDCTYISNLQYNITTICYVIMRYGV